MNQSKSEQEIFYKLSYYTLAHRDPSFIHQYIVDAFAAQCADENTKSIKLAFVLIGLYLHLVKNFSGKEVQQAHMKLAKQRKQWPIFNQPEHRGDITVYDVIATAEGSKRDKAIIKWSASVWESYKENHKKVADLVQTELWKP